MSEAMLHIASAVVKAHPGDAPTILAELASMPGTEVAAAEGGRIIIVIESDRHAAISETLDRIAGLHGVLSATLVYEHAEPEEPR